MAFDQNTHSSYTFKMNDRRVHNECVVVHHETVALNKIHTVCKLLLKVDLNSLVSGSFNGLTGHRGRRAESFCLK